MRVLACIIGNNDYFEGAKLDNAVNDAEAIARVFERLQFDVTLGVNCNIQESVELLEWFSASIGDYDASIFYFAGHGFQHSGENYLASVDCQVNTPNKYHCGKTCITLTELLDIHKNNSDKTNIVIIDACRKNFDRGINSTFSAVHAPKGTLIAFSTSPNQGAKDTGIADHSIYTGALLKFLGRERLSVEELFKKVRKTVYNLSEGTQTTWEHTSLIGDFYFNRGQLIHSVDIPYSGIVVRDKHYKSNGSEFSNVIDDMRSYDWNVQNPAIHQFLRRLYRECDENELFLMGRNFYQAGNAAYAAVDFMDNLDHELERFQTPEGKNHLLNGILFEIYFNPDGVFRYNKIKMNCFDKAMKLRNNPKYQSSFTFIRQILEPFRDQMYYFPGDSNIIDVDIVATQEEEHSRILGKSTVQVISSMKVGTKDIYDLIKAANYGSEGYPSFLEGLYHTLAIPSGLLEVNSNIELKVIRLL